MATDRKRCKTVSIVYQDEYDVVQDWLHRASDENLMSSLSPYQAERLCSKFGVERFFDASDNYRWADVDEVKEGAGRPRAYPWVYEMLVGDECSMFAEGKKQQQNFRVLVHQIGKKQEKKFTVNSGAGGHMFVKRVA